MPKKLHTFKLKLLSSSKDVGLRRLRSYAASIGGTAEIYLDCDEAYNSFAHEYTDELPSVLLVDSNVNLSPAELKKLSSKARIFLLLAPDNRIKANNTESPCWQVETLIQGTLESYLSSPVCRINAVQMCHLDKDLSFANLLRWGHARQIWTPEESRGITDVGLGFIRQFMLMGDWRRTTEMFCHFAECKMDGTQLENLQIDFASDGLMLANILRARPRGDMAQTLVQLNEELRMFNFGIAAINQLCNGEIEIAAYHCPVHTEVYKNSSILLTYNQPAKTSFRQDDEELEKAG